MSNDKDKTAFSLKAYRAAVGLLGPVADYTLKQRLKKGKEDPDRISERRGVAGLPRPEGPLIWIHGASVGESLSVLPLVERLSEISPAYRFLVTSGTVTSARLMGARLPACAIHQFAPLDHPAYVRRFLDHWRPDACIFVESELWPNLIQLTEERGVPMALVNGRVSPKSYENWKHRPAAIRDLLSSFRVILGQDQANQDRLMDLSGRDVAMLGNLKLAAAPLPAEADELQRMKGMIGARPVWLAASTHPGEEEVVLEAHRRVREAFPGLLTIIAPRHPERGEEISNMIRQADLVTARRSRSDRITEEVEVYLADTLGELGIFYRLTDIAFVGGSIAMIGGHNPLEPARLRTSILYGPHIFNFAETYRDMRASGGTALFRNERDLTASLIRLLTDSMTRQAMAERAGRWAEESAEEVLNGIVAALQPVLPAQTPETSQTPQTAGQVES